MYGFPQNLAAVCPQTATLTESLIPSPKTLCVVHVRSLGRTKLKSVPFGARASVERRGFPMAEPTDLGA